nr:hypothetical protein [Tanacetum cinerariifolium]
MRGRKNSSDMRVPVMIRASMTLSSSWVTIIRVPLQRPLVLPEGNKSDAIPEDAKANTIFLPIVKRF